MRLLLALSPYMDNSSCFEPRRSISSSKLANYPIDSHFVKWKAFFCGTPFLDNVYLNGADRAILIVD